MDSAHRLGRARLFPACLALLLLATAPPRAQQADGGGIPLEAAPAVHKFGVEPAAATRAALVAVPLREDWAVPQVAGRPALGFSGSTRWQFRTVDAFPSGSVHWAVGRALVTAGGGVPVAGLAFDAGSGSSGQPDVARTLAGGGVRVDTGVLLADIWSDAFNLLDRVSVDGVELVKTGSSPGILARAADGALLAVAPGLQLTVVENGPAFALLKAEGALERADGTDVVDFTCRLGFTWGSREVEVTFTVRNANIAHPQHVSLASLELVLKLATGAAPVARLALPSGETSVALGPTSTAWAYQAFSDAFTEEVNGSGTAWLPPIPKTGPTTFAQEGYLVGSDAAVLQSFDKTQYPQNGWLDLSGAAGGCTVAIRHMPYVWPAALEAGGAGHVAAGIFTPRNLVGHTWSWRQHESRTAVFSFHAGPAAAPAEAARRLDAPVIGRMADFAFYRLAEAFPYDVLTPAEHDLAYALLGVDHALDIGNLYLTVTRFLPSGATGGENNHDYVERLLASEYLRLGRGGQWLTAMDLALWKSESQVPRSDNFHHEDDPGPLDDSVPHTKNIIGDNEHRYRGGLALAWYLTGDERLRDALLDEAEVLPGLKIWAQERSMYQTLVALAEVADATHQWAQLDPVVAERVQFYATPLIDIPGCVDGYGWDGPPGIAPRGCYVYSEQSVSEKPPGENYITRGFITASMGPRALYRAARHLGPADPAAQLASLRLQDLARYTRDELFPFVADPLDRHLVYSYGVKLAVVNSWEQSDFHPILLGMAEAWRQTGDPYFLLKGLEQVEAFEAHGNLEWMDKRLEAQHYLRAVLDALGVM
jgi:hypothetical protein